MTDYITTLAFGGIALIALPALLFGGWLIVVALGGIWLLVTYGGKLGFAILKERQSGASAAKYESKYLKGDSGRRWDR